MGQTHSSATAASPTQPAGPLPRTLSLESLQAIIDRAAELWANRSNDELEIGAPDDPCCGSNAGDIENMISRGEDGTWVRAWVWVADSEVPALQTKEENDTATATNGDTSHGIDGQPLVDVGIDNFDARVGEDDPTVVEIGTFEGEENRHCIPISIDDAIALNDALSLAISEALRNRIQRRISHHNVETVQLTLTIPEAAWRDDTPTRDRSHLLGCVFINGGPFHIDAIAVEQDDKGILKAMNPDYAQELEGFYSLSAQEGGFTTVTIFEREYVIGITPAR